MHLSDSCDDLHASDVLPQSRGTAFMDPTSVVGVVTFQEKFWSAVDLHTLFKTLDVELASLRADLIVEFERRRALRPQEASSPPSATP